MLRTTISQTLWSILLPGFIFQSVIIAGGYGTGREIVSFFLSQGPPTGLLGMILAGALWATLCALTFEYARQFQLFDYRTFFKHLLGKQWWLFEVSFLVLSLVVLAVVTSSFGHIVALNTHLSYNQSVGIMLATVLGFIYLGNRFIERSFSITVVGLYIAYLLLMFFSLKHRSLPLIFDSSPSPDFIQSGFAYAGYNLGLIPAVLFSLKYLNTRKHAIASGLIAGAMAIMPAIGFYFALLTHYPDILNATLPSQVILAAIDRPWLSVMYNGLLGLTLIESAVGLIHAINERFGFQQRARLSATAAMLACTLFAAQFGLVALIEAGYAQLTWVIIAIYIAPLSTIGLRQLIKHSPIELKRKLAWQK